MPAEHGNVSPRLIHSSPETNNSTSDSPTSVARGQGQFVTTAAKVISACMQHARAPDDTQGSLETDLLVRALIAAITLCIRLHIAQVTDVSHLIVRACVHVPMRIVVRARRCAPVR